MNRVGGHLKMAFLDLARYISIYSKSEVRKGEEKQRVHFGCCIYEKPRAFGESSTESEDEDDEGCGNAHCIRGHKKGQQGKAQDKAADAGPSAGGPRKSEPPDQNHAGAMQH
uniref:Uncharacterized protein n=1 Tax=Sphaerodactylus townsendi TaxID=933632 RepID=A0ACB8EH70_9SAUR